MAGCCSPDPDTEPMHEHRVDRVTDWIAIALSTIIAATLWAMFVAEWWGAGAVSAWLAGVAGLMTMLAVLTLFGAEKVRTAIKLRREAR